MPFVRVWGESNMYYRPMPTIERMERNDLCVHPTFTLMNALPDDLRTGALPSLLASVLCRYGCFGAVAL